MAAANHSVSVRAMKATDGASPLQPILIQAHEKLASLCKYRSKDASARHVSHAARVAQAMQYGAVQANFDTKPACNPHA